MEIEKGEPALRSCWECNVAHEHLKDVNFLHWCFSCGRYWLWGRYFDFDSDVEFDEFFKNRGMGSGESTLNF